MDFGQAEGLPDAAKGEDLSIVSGRLRAAMVRASKRAHYADLKEMIDAAEKEAGRGPINKQTVHNWFKPTCKFIDQEWLFKIAKLLNVNPEWLATGEGRMTPPVALSDEHEQTIGVWKSLPSDEARQAWLQSGQQILTLLKSKTAAVPYPPTPSEAKSASKPRR